MADLPIIASQDYDVAGASDGVVDRAEELEKLKAAAENLAGEQCASTSGSCDTHEFTVKFRHNNATATINYGTLMGMNFQQFQARSNLAPFAEDAPVEPPRTEEKKAPPSGGSGTMITVMYKDKSIGPFFWPHSGGNGVSPADAASLKKAMMFYINGPNFKDSDFGQQQTGKVRPRLKQLMGAVGGLRISDSVKGFPGDKITKDVLNKVLSSGQTAVWNSELSVVVYVKSVSGEQAAPETGEPAKTGSRTGARRGGGAPAKKGVTEFQAEPTNVVKPERAAEDPTIQKLLEGIIAPEGDFDFAKLEKLIAHVMSVIDKLKMLLLVGFESRLTIALLSIFLAQLMALTESKGAAHTVKATEADATLLNKLNDILKGTIASSPDPEDNEAMAQRSAKLADLQHRISMVKDNLGKLSGLGQVFSAVGDGAGRMSSAAVSSFVYSQRQMG